MIHKGFLPQALSIGVDYKLFWSLNPRKLEPFIEAFKQKIKYNQEQNNFTSWLTGMYATHAIAAVFGKNHNYPNQPISFDTSEIDREEKSKQDAQRFEAFAISFNSEMRKKNKEI